MKQAVRTHLLFGFNLASDFPFENRLRAGTPPVDLSFSCVPGALAVTEGLAPVYSSHAQNPDGESISCLFRLEMLDLLRFTGVADYYVSDRRIDCHLRDPDHGYLVEIQLLGSILSFWLERRGLPTLHSSAVEVGGRAVGFLSSNSGGKTGLAAAMMRRGHPLVTDDVLPVEDRQGTFLGRPGYPQMRMWPDEAAHFLGRWQDLEIVHPAYSKRRVVVGSGGFGRFCDFSRPLACLYLPQRRPTDRAVEIQPVSQRDAVIELIRHSFSPYVVEVMGWQASRLDFFARLVDGVAVRRIFYPTGFEHLPAVCDEIERDLERF